MMLLMRLSSTTRMSPVACRRPAAEDQLILLPACLSQSTVCASVGEEEFEKSVVILETGECRILLGN